VRPRIGVLALQGDFAAHRAALEREGLAPEEIRYPAQLRDLDALIVPGGESTTLLHLIADLRFESKLREFHRRGGAIFGTCAGAILVARGVSRPEQMSLGFIDIDVERNAYGRQRESFETSSLVPALGSAPFPMIFIRAPRIRRVGAAVEVISTCEGEPVLVRQGRVLASTFHPELSPDGRLHRYFAGLVDELCLIPS
jgi:5'-phosphate synthase pdxT subunit